MRHKSILIIAVPGGVMNRLALKVKILGNNCR